MWDALDSKEHPRHSKKVSNEKRSERVILNILILH
jgi:hypothetical protein